MKLWTILGETVLLFICYYFCNFASYETLHNNMVLKSSNCYCGSTWEGKYSILKYFKLNFPNHLKFEYFELNVPLVERSNNFTVST